MLSHDTPFSLPAEKIFSLIDLTDLSEDCTEEAIHALCQKASRQSAHVAAVCIPPAFVKTAVRLLANSPVAIATVVNFPAGTQPLSDVLKAIRQALRDGANEIDLVFPRADFFSGHAADVKNFLLACRQATAGRVLKIIMESGAFAESHTLEAACQLACEAGADFLKTSTGKLSSGATPAAALTLLSVIQRVSPTTGIKISGGIRTHDQAMTYLSLAADIMGSAWISKTHFRIGASQLIEDPIFKAVS